MDNIDTYRKLMESVGQFLEADDEDQIEQPSDEESVDTGESDEYTDSQDEQPSEEPEQEPAASIVSIMGTIKQMVDVLSSGDAEKIAELKTGLNDLSLDFKDLCDTVCGVAEDCNTDKMEPALVQGVETYNDPNGDSYAARNGFTG